MGIVTFNPRACPHILDTQPRPLTYAWRLRLRINFPVQLKKLTDFNFASNSIPLCLTMQPDLRVRPTIFMALAIFR